MDPLVLNAIIVPGNKKSNKYKLCLELLIINRITRTTDDFHSIDLKKKKNGTKDTVEFIAIDNKVATYENLVSIFKPFGFKVINDNKFKKIFVDIYPLIRMYPFRRGICESYDYTDEDIKTYLEVIKRKNSYGYYDGEDDDFCPAHIIYNELYDEGEHHNDYKIIDPEDLLEHYKNVRNNLDSLNSEENRLNVHRLTEIYLRKECNADDLEDNIQKIDNVFKKKVKALEG